MNDTSSPYSHEPAPVTLWERWASLLGRLLIFFAMVYVPLVFFTWTWRHYHVPKTASFQFLILLLLACTGILLCKRRMVHSALATPASFFFLVIMITGLGAVNMAESWETIAFQAACMVMIILIPKFLTRFKDFEILVYLIGIMCLLVDLYALGQWYGWDQIFVYTEKLFGLRRLTPKPVSFMGNENYAAEFLNMTLPICFAMMICFRRQPAQLFFYSIVTLMNAIVMVYIDCNASFAGFMVAIPIAAIIMIYFKAIPWSRKVGLFQKTRKELERIFRQAMVVLIVLICVGGTLIASVDNPIRTKMASMASWMDVDGDLIPDGVAPIVFRLQCMDAAARNIIDSPVMGIGAGNFKVMHPLYESQLERKVLGEETLARKVHNDHLYHAVEFGMFGLFGWYWIIAATFFAILLSLRLIQFQTLAAEEPDPAKRFYKGIILPAAVREFYFYLLWGILTGLIVALVSCAFGHTFVISSSAVIYWLLSGVSVAVYQHLALAKRGIRLHLFGITREPVNEMQKKASLVPSPVWVALLFSLVLPFGALNTYQLIGETWLRHGMTLKEENDFQSMFQCFQKSLDYYPYQMETFYILGRYYIDSIVAVESSMLPNGKPIPPGLRAEDLPRYNQEGVVVLQTDIFMNPNYKWAHNNLGVIYDRYYDLLNKHAAQAQGEEKQWLNQQKEAVMAASVQTYNRVLEIDDEQVMALFNLGLGSIKQGNWKKASEFLNDALLTDPTRYDIYQYLSSSYIQEKDYKRAVIAADKYMEKLILIDVKKKAQQVSDPSQLNRIIQLLKERQYPQAVTLARLLLQWTDDKVYNLYLSSADALSKSKEKEDQDLARYAVEMAEKVIAKPTGQTYVWHANVYQRLGDYKKAAEKLEEFLRMKPEDDEIRHTLMMLYVQMADLASAEKNMAYLVKKHPDNWPYLITYARLLAGLNSPWKQIYPYVQKSVQLGGDEARKVIVEKQPGNLIYPFIAKEPSLQDLLGPSFIPSTSSP